MKGSTNFSNSVVFVGPYEHHSVILIWRELGCKVVMIGEDFNGHIDLNQLESELIVHKEYETKIGCFSAASNVTGIITDVNKITILLHRYDAFAFWDYATAGPYVDIDMNAYIDGPDKELVYKDAIFLSTHKFIGGPGTPGILVVKKKFFNKNLPPSKAGGGTVFFVTSDDHRYLSNLHEREEGGTPDIVGSIRAGLVFQLKYSVGTKTIEEREKHFVKVAFDRLSKIPNLHILGSTNVPRIAILSFLISHPSGRFLHYNFVCSLLNDLFGIQSRGGCMCAGPYSQHLLGIDHSLAKEFEEEMVQRDENEILRPGYVRINLNFFINDDDLNYILDCVEFVATKGWMFLSEYTYYEETNEWVHFQNKKFPDRRWLDKISYQNGKMEWAKRSQPKPTTSDDYKEYIKYANDYLDTLNEKLKNKRTDSPSSLLLPESAEKLRWFVYPHESHTSRLDSWKIGQTEDIPASSILQRQFKENGCPFFPRKYEGSVDYLPNNAPSKTNTIAPSTVTTAVIPKSKDVVSTDKLVVDSSITCPVPSKYKEIKNKSSTSAKARSAQKKTKNNNKPKDPKKEEEKLKRQISRSLYSHTVEAIEEFSMIKDGDRVLLGLSGGKDSLTLLHILLDYQKAGLIKFDLGCTTVDPQTISYDPSPLKQYLAGLGIPYYYESQGLIERAKEQCPTSICAWCSRMKRGILCQTARKHGYNKLALAQHLDDLAESFLMYLFHNGRIDTMRASAMLEEKDLMIIRPFVYVRELQTKRYAKYFNLPVITENCPACFAEPKERKRIKALLAAQENLFPDLFKKIRAALHPIMHGRLDINSQFEKLLQEDKQIQDLTDKLKTNGSSRTETTQNEKTTPSLIHL
eukprot:TRINITY_DN4559_c0_g2_i2.p1 TRINITY_DN4559_c0_g2~~TRINITY_DN4559_c0_g2_i2.p1  ORF type:complete len:860 (+),score=152.31 TRINITY_DN4559_c0_g2_i2:1444-4023(+)